LPFAELPGDPGAADDVPVAGFDPYGREPVQQQPQQQAQGGGFFDALRGLFGGNRQPQAQPAQARPQAGQQPGQRQNRQQQTRDAR
jgi:hypothetical protein